MSFALAAIPAWVALLPLGGYLLVLGWLHLRRRPAAIPGGLDIAALAVGLSGLVLAGPLALLQPAVGTAPWAALMMLGENGYMDLVRRTLSYRDRLWKGIRAIDGLELVGEPDMSVFCFRSTKHDIFSIGAKLEKRGWRIDRQNNPPAIHMIVTPNHRLAVSAFLRDLKNIVATEPLSKGKAPAAVGLYGVTSSQTSGANPVESLYRGLESNYE